MFAHVLQSDPDADLCVLMVWSPILSTDDREAAEALAAELDDSRALLFWDGDKAVGKALKSKLAIGGAELAWDVYCFFGADEPWGDTVPDVAKWAHQLGGADESHYFGDRLGETLQAWTVELTGGESSAAQPAPQPKDVFTVSAEEIRPITEVLLDQILDDLAQQPDSTIEPDALAAIAAELRRRMAEATRPHAEAIPRALRHGGRVYIVPPSDCAPSAKSAGSGAEEK